MHPQEKSRSHAIFEGHHLAIGQFVCPITAFDFSDTGPIKNGPLVVFPRIGVEITHAGHRPLIADPNTVVFYNEGQEYRRGKVSPFGDRCEWFAVAPSIVREVVSHVDPSATDQEYRLFRVTHGPSDPNVYFLQRVLVEYVLKHAQPNRLYVEELGLMILEKVVAKAYGVHFQAPRRPSHTMQTHKDLVHAAKRMMATAYAESLSLESIATALYVSPYHLCRVFRQQTGNTLHYYLNQIRLRASLEVVAEGKREVTAIAFDLGYSSHSHFTSAFRQSFGMPPSTFQRTATGASLRNFSNILIA